MWYNTMCSEKIFIFMLFTYEYWSMIVWYHIYTCEQNGLYSEELDYLVTRETGLFGKKWKSYKMEETMHSKNIYKSM